MKDKINVKKLSRLLAKYLAGLPSFGKALKVVKENGSGRIWLIGGGVSRSLVHVLYKVKPPDGTDFDFIVEKAKRELVLPNGWTMMVNKYGNPKFKKGSLTIDFIPLRTIYSIRRRNLHPSIKNYLSGTPLTIQSLAYDVKRKLLVGPVGVRSILEKKVSINNRLQYLHYSRVKGYRGYRKLKEVAQSLGFKAVL